MKENLDELLTHALTPTDTPSSVLNQNILNQVKENKIMEKKRFPAIALIAVAILCLSSVTAYAFSKYLSPDQVAEKMQDRKLADYFADGQGLQIGETQSYGGYNITLLGIISGKQLSDYQRNSNGQVLADRTFAVTAIENADGTPMPDTSEDAYGELNFFVSPLIGGYNPAFYNAASMHGNYTEFNEDGILYRLVECDNVEIFADHPLYLCVSDTMFYNAQLYQYDENTGTIARSEDYEGLNALFDLPLDTSKADPEKAAEYIESLDVEPPKEVNHVVKTDHEEGSMLIASESLLLQISGSNEKGMEVVEYALQYLDTPYAFGKSNLTDGTDSSGFVMSVYEHFDISLPHSAAQCKMQGTSVESLEDAEPGDLICFDDPSHVAIYMGDGKIVHATPEDGVCVSEIEYEISDIRKVINVD